MKTLLLCSAVLISSAALSQQVLAQTQTRCGERSDIVSDLATKFGETPRGVGINHDNSIIEIFASDETGTWTALVRTPSGRTCIVAWGTDWDGNPSGAEKAEISI